MEEKLKVYNFSYLFKGAVQKALKAKVAIFTCALDIALTETKGTVLLHSSKELMDFSAGEEKQLELV